jgi:oligoendopeptidase F
VFHRLDPQLGEFFDYMAENNLLDLGNRPGKAAGGYKMNLYEQRLPFIFMNAVGTKRDVETVLHEGGHSFNDFLARDKTLVSYREPSAEFAEVASMSMELLAREQLGEFYSAEDLERLHAAQLRDVLRILPALAMHDAFQHWAYTTADSSPEARKAKWAELTARFQPWIDWSGLEQYRDLGWQILHVMVVPFYVVEYAIAQLAALRIWLNSLKDHAAALAAYKRALALGGSRPLPELFSAAGAHFGLDDATVRAIMEETAAQMKWD